MSLDFVHWETGETIAEDEYPKAIMWVVGDDADALKNSEMGGFFHYEALTSYPEVGSAAFLAVYTPPDEAKSAGWASPADVFADDKTRSYLDVFSFVEVGEDRPALEKNPTTCGLLTCKCVCECCGLHTRDAGAVVE